MIRSYRGPLIAIALGIGFVLVGAVPVTVTFCINSKGSSTIIGVGFMGFGLLLILPGIIWCLVRRASSMRCCHSHQERLHPDDEYVADEELPGSVRTQSITTQPKMCYIMTTDDREPTVKAAIYFDIDKQDSEKDTGEQEQDTYIEDDVNQDNGDVRLTR
jgi:hypothetical protein